MDQQQTPRLDSVFVDVPFCPVVDSAIRRKCYFASKNLAIYNFKKEIGVTTPIPIALPSSNAVRLGVKLDYGSKFTGVHRIQAELDGRAFIIPQVITPNNFNDNGFAVSLNFGGLKPLPWAFTGVVTWYCIPLGQSSTETYCMGHSYVKIFIVSPRLPKCLIDYGIPLNLLEFPGLLPAWKELATTETWPSFVISTLFNDGRLIYETSRGGAKYSAFQDWDPKFPGKWVGEAQQVYIDLWLSDMNGISDTTNPARQITINCYDAAMISHVIISIGVEFADCLQLQYLQPFGFLNPTKLLGRTLGNSTCNNPFPGVRDGNQVYDNNLTCVPLSQNRSRFWDHMFLTYANGPNSEPKVYDLCTCKVGEYNIAGYINATIDSTFGLAYWNSDTGPRKGTIQDVKPINGPLSLVLPVSFECEIHPNPTLYGIFAAMAKAFPPNRLAQAWDTAYRSLRYGTDSVGAVWSYVPAPIPNSPIRIYVSITRYKNVNDFGRDFDSYRGSLHSANQTVDQGDYKELLSSHDGTWTCVIGRVVKAGKGVVLGQQFEYYVVVIEGCNPRTDRDVAISQAIVDTRDLIMNKIFPTEREGYGWDPRLKINNPVDPASDQTVGDIFSIFFYASQSEKDSLTAATWFKACKTFTKNGNVLLLSADESPRGPKALSRKSIELVFLARAAGAEVISVIMYGQNLDFAQQDFQLNILPAL